MHAQVTIKEVRLETEMCPQFTTKGVKLGTEMCSQVTTTGSKTMDRNVFTSHDKGSKIDSKRSKPDMYSQVTEEIAMY